MKRMLRMSWGLACLAVLALTIVRYEVTRDLGVSAILAWGMLILCFPVSFLVSALIAALILIQDTTGVRTFDVIQSPHLGYFILWLLFIAPGYWQWFHLVPCCIENF